MEKLGIEPSLLLAQVINFSIIVVVLTKLLYAPILAMLEKRKKEIEEGIAVVAHQREEEEKFAARKEKLLAEARREARVILEEAKSQAKLSEHDILATAHKEAGDIIQKAKQDALGIHDALAMDMRKEAVILAGAMTKRLTASILTPADQHKLIAKHLETLEKNKAL